jgi:CheY-like chemotaxis protein
MDSRQQTSVKDWDIVVVDDDPYSLDIAKIILTHHKANVHTAINGQQALEVIRAVSPRFIISDISMPVMDGWEMIRHLKSDSRTMNIPVIALTAHAMIGDRERAIAAGCHNYMSKPLTPATFMQDLLNLLNDIPELNITNLGEI